MLAVIAAGAGVAFAEPRPGTLMLCTDLQSSLKSHSSVGVLKSNPVLVSQQYASSCHLLGRCMNLAPLVLLLCLVEVEVPFDEALALEDDPEPGTLRLTWVEVVVRCARSNVGVHKIKIPCLYA